MYVHGLEVEFDVATKLIQTKRICSNLEMTLISFLHKWNDLFEGFQIWHSTQISSCWLQSALSIEVRGLSEPGGLGGYAPPPQILTYQSITSQCTEVGRALLIHFQKWFLNKVFIRIKIARKFKFYVKIIIFGS